MFDRLIDLVVEFMGLFQVIVFIDHYEKGVILRRGKFHRVVDPGWRWVQPAGQDKVFVANVKPEPMYLDVQSLHTVDDYPSNIQIGLIWRITDIKTFLLENGATEDMVGLLCSGVVSRSFQGCKWTEIRDPGYPDTLRAPMNRKVRKRGAEIDEVVIQDFASGSANRLWVEGVTVSLGEDE